MHQVQAGQQIQVEVLPELGGIGGEGAHGQRQRRCTLPQELLCGAEFHYRRALHDDDLRDVPVLHQKIGRLFGFHGVGGRSEERSN